MRKIKFRAWCKNEKNFLYGNNFWLGNSNEDLNELFRLKEFDFQQYTGLKDKNSVEIYEGDIIKTNLNHKYVIKYEENAFMIGFERFENMEVIGNIYEHPHLLKEEL